MYFEELQTEVSFLQGALTQLQSGVKLSGKDGNMAEYVKFLDSYLKVQKQYLRLCAELEKLTKESANNG